jgi:uncharacterized protein DUF2510
VTQPGWYPDPSGSGAVRWWDGTSWTQHVQAPSAPVAPAQPVATPGGHPASGQVLDTVVRRKPLHADPQHISYKGQTLALAHVEWIAYWVVQSYMKDRVLPIKAGLGSQWTFQVGRYPFKKGPMVDVLVPKATKADSDVTWSFLVNLARQHIEPRLVAEIAAQVRAGHTVTVGHSVQVHPGGIAGTRSLSWAEIGGAHFANGTTWITDRSNQPVLGVPMQNPNAVLFPALLTTLLT